MLLMTNGHMKDLMTELGTTRKKGHGGICQPILMLRMGFGSFHSKKVIIKREINFEVVAMEMKFIPHRN